MTADDDFDPVEYARQRRNADEAWAKLVPMMRLVQAQAASPLTSPYQPVRFR